MLVNISLCVTKYFRHIQEEIQQLFNILLSIHILWSPIPVFFKISNKREPEILVPFYFYHFGISLKSEIGNTTQYLGIHAIPMLRTMNDITFLLLTINSKDHGHKTETDFRLMTLTQILMKSIIIMIMI